MNRTSRLHLPLFEASDKPSWLTDWNNAMNILDEAISDLEIGSIPGIKDLLDRLTAVESKNSEQDLVMQDLYACFAPNYATTVNYTKGSIVIYAGLMYECTDPLGATGEWDGSKWAHRSVKDFVDTLISDIADNASDIADNTSDISALNTRVTALEQATPTQLNAYSVIRLCDAMGLFKSQGLSKISGGSNPDFKVATRTYKGTNDSTTTGELSFPLSVQAGRARIYEAERKGISTNDSYDFSDVYGNQLGASLPLDPDGQYVVIHHLSLGTIQNIPVDNTDHMGLIGGYGYGRANGYGLSNLLESMIPGNVNPLANTDAKYNYTADPYITSTGQIAYNFFDTYRFCTFDSSNQVYLKFDTGLTGDRAVLSSIANARANANEQIQVMVDVYIIPVSHLRQFV